MPLQASDNNLYTAAQGDIGKQGGLPTAQGGCCNLDN